MSATLPPIVRPDAQRSAIAPCAFDRRPSVFGCHPRFRSFPSAAGSCRFPADQNPKHNPVLNPNHNPVLNPKHNAAWGGYNLFNLEAKLVGRAVRADKKVIVLLSTKSEWVGYFVSNEEKGYNWFDAEGEWKGYLIHNGQKGYSLFNIDGEWAGFLALKQ